MRENKEPRRFNRSQRTALYLAQNGKCANCGVDLEASWHADHMHPYRDFGKTDVVNGQALCPNCNLRKGTTRMEEQKPLREWQREALNLYDQHQGKFFLLEACPGAGKSRFIAEVVKRELHKAKAEAILVVVPSRALRKQMANDFHEETGIQLDPEWNGDGVPLVHGTFQGAVVTYQWLASSGNAALLRRHISRHTTLAVLDEVHHAQDEKPWGDALKTALEPATKVLLTTGTPFTSNGNPIAFLQYDKDGISVPDYSYNYGQALANGIVRSIFFNHHRGEMQWEDEQGTVRATFSDRLNKRDVSRRLRTAIHEDKEHVGALLRESMNKLRELRADDPDAAMLIVAVDQAHAKKLAKRMQQELGVIPLVAVSEDGDAAAGTIKAFKKSTEPCIIAVNMISEGVNIPRIRVIVYATNVTTYLYFMQVLGRASRTEPNHEDQTAWVFIPDDQRFREFANKLMRQCEEALIAHERKESSTGERNQDIDQDTIWFTPISASFSEVVATVNGIAIDAGELQFAATFKATNPAMKGPGFSREHIATVLKAVGFNFSLTSPVTPTPTAIPNTPEPDKPHYERIKELKAQGNAFVAPLHYKKGIDYQDINMRLNKAVGIISIDKCFDIGQLELRRKLAKRWLIDGITPEEP